VHCSRVFRSSVPSDLLPSSPGGARQALFRMNAAALDQRNGGSPRWQSVTLKMLSGIYLPVGTSEKTRCRGRSALKGRVAIRDPELVGRARRAATRLESACNNGALHGLAVAPGQPVVSYAGYSVKEPWVNPGS
jgi:hypothetical protein